MSLSVVSSSYSSGATQADGSHWIVETITISDGSTQMIQYLAAPGCDLDAHLTATVNYYNTLFSTDDS